MPNAKREERVYWVAVLVSLWLPFFFVILVDKVQSRIMKNFN